MQVPDARANLKNAKLDGTAGFNGSRASIFAAHKLLMTASETLCELRPENFATAMRNIALQSDPERSLDENVRFTQIWVVKIVRCL